MHIVSAQDFERWIASGTIIEKDGHGPKVVELDSGQLLKIFRTRRSPLLERLSPAAKRFKRHGEQLKSLGILVPEIGDCFWTDASRTISGCRYIPLEGRSLEAIFHENRTEFTDLIPAFARFIQHLHQLGIYFRSLHLGNVLLTAPNEFGLIDFLDIRFRRRPLGPWMIRRNFAHLESYLKRRNIDAFPLQMLKHAYAEASKQSN